MKKRILSLLLAVVMVAALTACGGNDKKEPESADALKLALVVADKFGDRSFYDSSKDGCDQLVADRGVELTTIECNGENHAAQIRNAADVADVVVCVGWEFFDVETIAPDYPNVKFIWIDNATAGRWRTC